jgi:Carboxypeptidase regulatory-like domain
MSRLLTVVSVLLVTSTPVVAQTVTATTGAINGTVTDSTKAVLPGVTVTLSGPSLMGTPVEVTDQSGTFRFSAVPPGTYTLTHELTGFRGVTREGIVVTLGFTATVNSELNPGAVSENITVSGAAPVVDVKATEVTTHFDSDKLASLPGARDFWSVLAQTPAISMAKMDVGGSGALNQQAYTAYGLGAVTGMNRNEVEGIRVGAANGANDNYYSDYGSFAEIAVKATGNTASMSVPGTLGQYVSKSGGNAYHGSLYADYQNETLESTNIDAAQVALGVTGGPGLDVHNVNRLQIFRDFNTDLGGYLKKDALWWYGAFRYTKVGQRYAWLLDDVSRIQAPVETGKVTYNLTPRQKFIGYVQNHNLNQPDYFSAGSSLPFESADALPGSKFPVTVWKGEYNSVVSDALYVEVRAGAYLSGFKTYTKSTTPRIADTGANTVSGGADSGGLTRNRPQANGALSYFKNGRGGSHTLKVGGEWMVDHLISPETGYGNPCQCVSTLNNGAPTQVLISLGENVSKNDLATLAGYVDDNWQLDSRLSLSLGLRLDHYAAILPEQEGPTGQHFPAINPVVTWNNWGPRLGVSADLTGNGKTILKFHYGHYWLYPGVNFTSSFNPNPSGWTQAYVWTNDANRNGRWDPGEEGRLTSSTGGSTSTKLDPEIKNSYVRQATVYLEREAAANLGVRTGFVWNGRRQGYGTVNVNRPLAAYTVPVAVRDPGPDGRLNGADDGPAVTVFGLSNDYLNLPVVNITENLSTSDADYYTLELTATRRQTGRWSMLASFAETWSHETALGTGTSFNPNVLINTEDGLNLTRTWQAKISATVTLPMDLRLVPIVRHQSGTPFARTFTQTLNYGAATIKAEPVGAERTPNVTLFDVRAEKSVKAGPGRIVGFLDVYNVLNTNAAQTLTQTSGGSWLRPTAITGPRIARIGTRLEW